MANTAGETSARAHFSLPYVEDNPDGWGPVSLPKDLQDIPYAPFSKSDKIGRIADWTNVQNPRYRQIEQYRDRLYNTGFQNEMFTYFQEEDEGAYQLVDSRPQRNRNNAPGFRPIVREDSLGHDWAEPAVLYCRELFVRFATSSAVLSKTIVRFWETALPQNRNFQRGGGQRGGGGGGGGGNMQRLDRGRGGRGGGGRGGRGGRRFQSWRDFDKRSREASIEAKPDWEMLEEITFGQLASLQFEPPEGETLTSCGAVEVYNRAYDRVTTSASKPLRTVDRLFYNVTTQDDPKIREFAEAGDANVFGIDSVIALLMSAGRSVYSWDIVVTRTGNQLYFDKRDRSPIDFLTVCETAAEPPFDDPKDIINSPDSLSVEATYINRNFSQQILKSEERVELDEPNPFADGSEEVPVASVGYRYRRWPLGDGISLIVRCEVDAIQRVGGDQADQFMNIKALNEFDPKFSGVDWRQKLDTQRGAVIATELKNNGARLARWTSQALLAGSDILKLGFVSRIAPRDPKKHVLLGTHAYKPIEFANQMNLSLPNCWGILKALVDKCLGMEEGKYLFIKDPNKPALLLYRVPAEALQKEEDFDRDDANVNQNQIIANLDDEEEL